MKLLEYEVSKINESVLNGEVICDILSEYSNEYPDDILMVCTHSKVVCCLFVLSKCDKYLDSRFEELEDKVNEVYQESKDWDYVNVFKDDEWGHSYGWLNSTVYLLSRGELFEILNARQVSRMHQIKCV